MHGSLVPRPHLSISQGEVSGDNCATSWLCQVGSVGFEQTLITYLDDVGASFIGLRTCLDDMALFHWLVQIKSVDSAQQLFNSHQTLFLVRGLGMRLGAWIIPRPHNIM